MKRLLLFICLPLFGMDKPTDYEAKIRYTYPAGLYWCDGNGNDIKLSDEISQYIISMSQKEKPKLRREKSCEDIRKYMKKKEKNK